MCVTRKFQFLLGYITKIFRRTCNATIDTYFPWPPAKLRFVVRFARLASKSPATRPCLLLDWPPEVAWEDVPFVAVNPPKPPPNKSFAPVAFDPCGCRMSPKKFAPGAPIKTIMATHYRSSAAGRDQPNFVFT